MNTSIVVSKKELLDNVSRLMDQRLTVVEISEKLSIRQSTIRQLMDEISEIFARKLQPEYKSVSQLSFLRSKIKM